MLSCPELGVKIVFDFSACCLKVGLKYSFRADLLMTGCIFLQVLRIFSSYAASPTFQIIGKGPALLNNSFFEGCPSL